MYRWLNVFVAVAAAVVGTVACVGLAPADTALRVRVLPALPQPLSNNAVAAVRTEQGSFLVSFNGLGDGKDWQDTLNATYVLEPGASAWERAPDVPGDAGRLASIAVAVGDQAYVFGGYTVDEDHSEVSLPFVHRFDPRTQQFTALAPMPVPVDDAIALVYQQRYVYLISGWHDTANVNLVQRYDTHTDLWVQATAYPGVPVFGHAGGLVGDTLVVCGGVAIATFAREPREFVMNPDCYAGSIRADNARRIDWRRIDSMPGAARYRMASVGSERLGGVLFLGGSDNPYNYNGIGYNGVASEPVARVWLYDLERDEWRDMGKQQAPTMDHRGLLETTGGFVTLGGMSAGQQLLDAVLEYDVE